MSRPFYPQLDRIAQLMQPAFEKMVGALDHDQLFRFGQRGYQGFQFGPRTELVSRSAHEELGLGAIVQELKRVHSRLFCCLGDGNYRKSDSDGSDDPRIGAGSAQPDGGSERESGKDERQMVFGIHPIQRSTNIVDFTSALIVFAMTQSGAAEVKAQSGKSEAVQRLHRVESNFVVQRAAKQGMRMSHHGRVRRIFGTGIEQRLKPSCRTVKEERPDGLIRRIHLNRVANGRRTSDFGPLTADHSADWRKRCPGLTP